METTKNHVKRGEFVAEIVQLRQIGPELRAMRLALAGSGAGAFADCQPGQFVQLACRDLTSPRSATPLLRRPFSIGGLKITPDRIELEVMFRILGPGTEWLAHRQTSQTINLLGPLGRGFTFPTDKSTPIMLVGGGIGLPPMFFLADRLHEQGYEKVVGFAGARGVHDLVGTVYEEVIDSNDPLKPHGGMQEFARSNTPCVIATDNGSFGYAGSAVDALREYVQRYPEWGRATVYTCGPHGMLKATAQLVLGLNMKCQVCLESYMACGIGVCQSCAVEMAQTSETQKYRLVCAHGPVFDAEKILWE